LSSWNPDGTYRSAFFDTYVSGVDIGNGLDVSDPFVSAPVDFRGMLVDAEPYGAYTSQLFFDDMSFGIAGGCQVYGKRITRYSDRYINFFANPANDIIAGVASVMWQTVFDKNTGLDIHDHDSPALQALLTAMSSDDVLGAMVRWNSYRTVYFNNPNQSNGSQSQVADSEALIAKLNMGGFQPNPARSLIVGTLGLWRRGECPTEPSDRTLVSTLAPIAGQTSPADGGPAIGTAFVRTSNDALTFDLSNSMPCNSRTPTKLNVGPLSIMAADPPPVEAMMGVGTIDFSQYDMAAYEATSGIVTIPIDPGLGPTLDRMNLWIAGDSGQENPPTYLQEMPLRAVPTEPNIYATESELRSTIVQVYDRGVPAGSGVSVTWSVLGASDATHHTATTDAFGRIMLPVDTSQGNVYAYVFQLGDNPVLPMTNDDFNPIIYTYLYVRVLPGDAQIAAMEPTWANVHNYVLSNWEAIAPCMDNWLRLGDEAQVKAYAPIIKRLTDPAAFEEFRFMPVTRDLTAGQRTLLNNFLDGTTSDDRHADSMASSSEISAPKASGLNMMARSKAQRGG